MSNNSEKKDKEKPFQDIEFFSLKTTFKVILIILFIIFSFLLVFSIKTQAITQDINYTFDNDYIYNSNEGLNYSYFNIRNQTIITQGNFTATYDFLDNPIGSNPSNFFVDDTAGSIIIADNYMNHNRVIEINDTSNTERNRLFQYFSENRTNGIIEYWCNINDINKRFWFYLWDSGTPLLILALSESDIDYWNGGWNEIINGLTTSWYHIKIVFECGLEGLEGLSQYRWFVYINNVKYGSYTFGNNQPQVDWLTFETVEADFNYKCYVNALGSSWHDNYSIGQNVAYPNITITKIQEINKCEFAYNLTNYEPNSLDVKNIDNNWIENDDSTNTHIKTSGVYDEIEVGYYLTQLQNTYGISKEFSYNNDNLFNISFDITLMSLYNPHLDGWYFNIYTYDDTLLVSLLFKSDGSDIYLYYYDGSNYIVLHKLITELDFYFNIYINNRIILRLNDNDVIYNWFFPELTTNIGINTIEIIGGHKDDIGNYAHLTIDSIGLYINGTSYIPDDFSSIDIETNIDNWNDNKHNIFEVNGLGNFSFTVFYNNIFQDIIIPYSEFNNTLKRLIYLDDNIYKGSNVYTLKFISNESFSISETRIYANIIQEGSNIYYGSFSYNNIDTKESFFYIYNNRLYFTHNASNTEVSEYIRLTFNINNEYCLNSSISYNTRFLGISKAYFLLEYVSEVISIQELNLGRENVNIVLPQEQIISDFSFLITDNNNSNYLGYSEGSFSSIKLRFIPNIEISILTMSLINVMIPLFILILPSIVIAGVLGKKAIIPMMILMSIICYIAELIDLWLFTIIIMCLGSLLILQYKTKEGK